MTCSACGHENRAGRKFCAECGGALARAELAVRYKAIGTDGAPARAVDTWRVWNAHDVDQLRTMFPEHFYLDDRRRTGVGRLDGREACLDSLVALWELSRDLQIETLYFVSIAPHGRLYVCRWFGTNAEGGAFDAVFVCLARSRGDQTIGLEVFELEDLATARARFAALGAA